MSDTRKSEDELTPVDDVRRVRERLHREFGGDIARLSEHAHQVAEPLIKKLGLKPVTPPKGDGRRTGTQG